MRHVTLKLFVCFLVGLVAFFGCACSDGQLQKAKKVGQVCRFACDEANRLIPQLAAQGDLAPDEATVLTLRVAEVARVVAEYNEAVKTLNPNDRASPQRVAELTRLIADSLDRLNHQGILQIKNQRARERLGRILFAARMAAGALQAFLVDAGYPAAGGGNATT